MWKLDPTGAAGVQVGTAFALCAESGLRADLKSQLLERCRRQEARVFTDPGASPTSFPFKMALLDGTLSEDAVYRTRARVCDLGFLREAYRDEAGAIAYRCPAEPVSAYVAKGGKVEDTEGKRCLCNALLANIGLGHRRDGETEPALVTAGADLGAVTRFLPELAAPGSSYRAADVISGMI